MLTDADIAGLSIGNSDEDLLDACKTWRRAGGCDDFWVIVLALQ